MTRTHHLPQSHEVFLVHSIGNFATYNFVFLSVRIAGSDRAPDPAEGLNPKVVEVYTKYVSHLILDL